MTAWLDAAIKDLGQAEIPGDSDNPRVMAAFVACGHPEIAHDETANCAAYCGSWLRAAGYPIPPRDVNLLARSYLSYGRHLDGPEVGAICVLARGKPPHGHVGIVASVDEAAGKVRLIAGNVSDKVAYQTVRSIDALAWRWPVKATVSDLKDAGSGDMAVAAGIKKVVAATGGLAAGGSAAHQAVFPADADWTVLSDQVSIWQQLLGGINDVAQLIFGQPWLAAAAVGIAGGWWYARRLERNRVARAEAGAPLSSEL